MYAWKSIDKVSGLHTSQKSCCLLSEAKNSKTEGTTGDLYYSNVSVGLVYSTVSRNTNVSHHYIIISLPRTVNVQGKNI